MTKTSLTLGIPNTLNSLEPIEIKDEQANLHAAYVERYAVNNLPSEWDKEVEGFYVLLSHINPDNTFTAYVGKTVEELSRIQLNNDWQIREYMLAAEEIVALFSSQSQASSPQVISTKPSKGPSLFSRLAGK